MDKSEEEKTAAEIGNGISAPEAKRPRRCVQSKLSWHKPRVEETRAMSEEEDEESERSDEKSKKKKKKRKSQGKAPRKSPVTNKEVRGLSTGNKSQYIMEGNQSCQQLKNKQTGEATPKKAPTSRDTNHNGSSCKQRLTNKFSDATMDFDGQNRNTHHPSSDLWLEAKIAAEENVRLSAGKQTHPFFTSRKAAKRLPETQEITKLESSHWPGLDGDYLVSCPPIHVFDIHGDDITSLDWKNWAFSETTLLDLNGYSAVENTSSVFECSVKPLKLDTFLHKGMHLDQLSAKAEEGFMTSTKSDGQDANEQLLSNSEMVHVSSNISPSSRCVSCVGNLENEQQDRLLKERLASYHQRISCWPDFSLWTNKYQPENALEVCGNSESIRFLSEWLQSWHERGLQSSKNKKIVERCAIEDSEDSLYENESDMDDMDDGATLKNMLLITGPVGSGKSAAIYACAKEQGFEIIEVNASDLRNGAHIKQKFGEAMESHGFNKWSFEDPLGSRRKHIFELLSGPADIREEEFGIGSLEMASRTFAQDANITECSWNAIENRSSPCQVANKSLILFEDVDTVFDEDRGFISTIVQLAETAKRPIILTSNNKNPILPQLLDRFALDFTLPSSGELLSHLYMICASEKAHVSSDLLEHLIRSCLGDIRKTLMLLQFWCQGKRVQIDRNMQCCYSHLPFDIDAAHLVMSRLIPWGLRCKLSEKVGEEIDKAISMVEENLRRMEAVKQQEFNSTNTIDPSTIGKDVASPVKTRKKALLRRNRSFLDCTEYSDHANGLEDFSDTSDSLETNARRKVKHKPGIVLSSQSNDGSADELPCTDAMPAEPNGYKLPVMSTAPLLQTQEVLNLLDLPTNLICQSRMDKTVRHPLETFETASASHICDTFNLQDVSCVPESSFIFGTETNNEDDFLSMAISSNNTSINLAEFIRPIYVLPGGDTNNLDRTIIELSRCIENSAGNTCEIDVESVHGNEELGDSQNGDEEPPSSIYPLMDECSRADFSMRSVPGKNIVHSVEVDLIQETWRKLRCRHEDLKSCLSTNRKDASLLVKLASGLTGLISEADVMFSSCYPLVNDILDPSMIPCVEPDACSWHEEQFEMGSTYAQHGLCFYTSKCATVGSNLGCENTVDLTQEMLASSTNSMALGKLLSQGNTSQHSYLARDLNVKEPKCGISIGRELKSLLFDIILPTVPARLSMVLRGPAFHEYSSFMSQISKLECSRLSHSIEGRKRSRASRHYLSSGPFSLSPEHVELLARNCCFKR